MARKSTDIVPLMLRLRESLRHRVEMAAKANQVSLNAEVVERLEKSFEKQVIESLIHRAAESAAKAAGNAWVDRTVEAGLIRGDLAATVPWWMLYDWAKRHPDHPEAIRLLALPGFDAIGMTYQELMDASGRGDGTELQRQAGRLAKLRTGLDDPAEHQREEVQAPRKDTKRKTKES